MVLIKLEEKDFKTEIRHIKKYKDKDYLIGCNTKNNEFNNFIKAYNIKNVKKRYDFIYNYMCKHLDRMSKIYCDFKNDRCISNRLNKSCEKVNGCCYHYKKTCEYLKNKTCMRPNISCKLFMCTYVEKKLGYKSIPKNYLLLNYFFNRKQKDILRRSFRKTKKEIIDELIKNM